MIEEKSTYEKLAAINVNEHIERKGKFSYLSWSWAVDSLRKADPKAVWHVCRFDGMPYMKTDCGFFVEVAVTVDGITLSQIHPVLDERNRPILAPNAFQINTSIQRCLVKAIALHGLGLYIYSCEDLPGDGEKEEKEEETPPTNKGLDEFEEADWQLKFVECTDTETLKIEWDKCFARCKEVADRPAAERLKKAMMIRHTKLEMPL